MPRSSTRVARLPARRRVGSVAGFTLVELMVTCAVIAIVAVVGLPAITWLINAGRLQGQASDLSASLQLARSEAVRRNASVSVCASGDGSTCDGTWTNLITVVDSDDEVLNVLAVRPPVQVSGSATSITYRPNGFTTAVSFTVCIPTDSPKQNQRVVSVAAGGSVSTSKADGGGACT